VGSEEGGWGYSTVASDGVASFDNGVECFPCPGPHCLEGRGTTFS
jgi:hypothetical protein